MEEKLIDAIQTRPALYNLRDVNYKNTKMREKQWESVAAVVGETTKKCRQRWKTLRERARKEFLQKQTGSAASEPSTWPYLERMNFLKDTFNVTKTISNFTEDALVRTEGETFIIAPMTPSSNDEGSCNTPPITSTPSLTSNLPQAIQRRSPSSSLSSSGIRRKRNRDDEVVTKAVDSFNTLVSDIRDQYAKKKESPMELFFKNLVVRIEGRYTTYEELELQQAILATFIEKTKELDNKRNKN